MLVFVFGVGLFMVVSVGWVWVYNNVIFIVKWWGFVLVFGGMGVIVVIVRYST